MNDEDDIFEKIIQEQVLLSFHKYFNLNKYNSTFRRRDVLKVLHSQKGLSTPHYLAIKEKE